MALRDFLSDISLEIYENRFTGQGYNSSFDLYILNEKDLEKLEIRDETHRRKILEGGKQCHGFQRLGHYFGLIDFFFTDFSTLVL